MPVQLKTKRFIENDVWKLNFTLDTANLPESDKELIRKFGEPQINVGGTFLAGGADEYILPDKYIRVRTDLPYTQEFDSKSVGFDTNTEAKALAFQIFFENAYEQAFTTLRESVDTFTGEYIKNI
jgi:hypothetical protein